MMGCWWRNAVTPCYQIWRYDVTISHDVMSVVWRILEDFPVLANGFHIDGSLHVLTVITLGYIPVNFLIVKFARRMIVDEIELLKEWSSMKSIRVKTVHEKWFPPFPFWLIVVLIPVNFLTLSYLLLGARQFAGRASSTSSPRRHNVCYGKRKSVKSNWVRNSEARVSSFMLKSL